MAANRPDFSTFLPNFDARSVALLGACVVAVSMGAQAQVQAQVPVMAPARSGDTAFLRADTNRDGRLSRDEAQRLPAISERFDQIDVDHDQFISKAEFDEALKY